MWAAVTASALTRGTGDFGRNPNYLVPEPSKCERPKSIGTSRGMTKSQDKVAIPGRGDGRSGQAKHAGGNSGSQETENTLDCWLVSNWKLGLGSTGSHKTRPFNNTKVPHLAHPHIPWSPILIWT